jgi:hypothetical protein
MCCWWLGHCYEHRVWGLMNVFGYEHVKYFIKGAELGNVRCAAEYFHRDKKNHSQLEQSIRESTDYYAKTMKITYETTIDDIIAVKCMADSGDPFAQEHYVFCLRESLQEKLITLTDDEYWYAVETYLSLSANQGYFLAQDHLGRYYINSDFDKKGKVIFWPFLVIVVILIKFFG